MCPAFIWAFWSTQPLCSGEARDGASGEGEQAAGLQRDEGFPWQPLLAHSKDSSAVPQASFLWTLKPAWLAAESLTLERQGCGKIEGDVGRIEAKLFSWNWAALGMPQTPPSSLFQAGILPSLPLLLGLHLYRGALGQSGKWADGASFQGSCDDL